MAEEIDSEVLVMEALERATKAEAPSRMHIKEVIHKGDENVPVAIVVQALDDANWIYVWDNRTGDRSIVNRNMIPAQLRKQREDGSKVFTIHKPSVKPVRGKFKCLLHADDSNRAHYTEMGFPVCPKANLTSPYQVDKHMRSRHKVELETIQAEQAKAEKQKDKDFQERILTMAVEAGQKERPPKVS